MKKREESTMPRVTLQIDNEILKIVNNLRDKHKVNISAICRSAIVEWNNKLEGTQKEVK